MIWYCDSSALVKRYVREVSSLWFRREHGQHDLATSALTVVEVPAALARRMRDGSISAFEFHRGRTQLTRHLRSGQYSILPVASDVIQLAAILTHQLPLAAYDAVHLATALRYRQTFGVDLEQFCFVTADDQLKRAAQAQGLKTENPNDHV